VSVLLGDGEGTFQAAVSYGSGGSFTYSLAGSNAVHRCGVKVKWVATLQRLAMSIMQ
jgi:hypothetical protein